MTWQTLEEIERCEPRARDIIFDSKRWPDRYPIGSRFERQQRVDGTVYGPIEVFDSQAFEQAAMVWRRENRA